ncbi:Metal-tetracycline/H(+) antiporter [Dermatophilus congolensis]|uniref:Metal-tetracycline/H(+) antiporter n=1 Tax=Dermatophilus congolensis TaxID=1863 RepID=A0AA46BPG4_9MICO|nr:MFS transporter [Dermatophilus congolensis]STD12794.1 Metal-tetracycline/H(+) antiporter [Dermatophilus congolensis]
MPTTRTPIPREIWILVSAAFCVSIGFGLVAPVLPQYAASFNVGVQAASAIISAFAFARFAAAPASGALVDKLGERRIYMSGLLIVALSTGACALATNYTQLLTYRTLGGIGSAMFVVSSSALMVRLSPANIRGRCSSALGAAFLIGNIAGPIVGGLTAEAGYRIPFIVYATMLLTATAVVATFLTEPAPTTTGPHTNRPTITTGQALHHPAYRAVLLTAFSHGWANFGVRVALIPLYAAAMPTLGIRWAGIALTAFAIGNALALTTAGNATDRYGRRPFIIIGLITNGAATAALALSEALPLFLTASFIAGLGAGLIHPAQQAAIADIIGPNRNGGKVLSSFQMMMDAGTILGPVITGWTVTLTTSPQQGYCLAFTTTGILTSLAALAWLPVKETRTPQH